jgi:hypothetical protein
MRIRPCQARRAGQFWSRLNKKTAPTEPAFEFVGFGFKEAVVGTLLHKEARAASGALCERSSTGHRGSMGLGKVAAPLTFQASSSRGGTSHPPRVLSQTCRQI